VAFDEKTAERARRALSGQRGLVEKKMMGGICFMLEGNMCCGVSGSALLVRVGREAYQETLAEPHVRPMEFAGRRPTGFVFVDPEGHRSDAALATWVQRGVDFASTLPPKEAGARAPRPKAARR
jgi:hypothetical protein